MLLQYAIFTSICIIYVTVIYHHRITFSLSTVLGNMPYYIWPVYTTVIRCIYHYILEIELPAHCRKCFVTVGTGRRAYRDREERTRSITDKYPYQRQFSGFIYNSRDADLFIPIQAYRRKMLVSFSTCLLPTHKLPTHHHYILAIISLYLFCLVIAGSHKL